MFLFAPATILVWISVRLKIIPSFTGSKFSLSENYVRFFIQSNRKIEFADLKKTHTQPSNRNQIARVAVQFFLKKKKNVRRPIISL